MSRYKAYAEYKDSGVEWLDIVPKDWNVMQLKRTVHGCVNGIWGSEPKNNGDDTIVIRVADFNRSKLNVNDDGYTYRKIDEKEKVNRILKSGDLLLEKSGGGEKTLVGQVVLFDKSFDAVTSNFVAKMTPICGYDGRYLNYVFSRFYSDNINYCSIKQNTGIQNLDSASYLTEKIGFPTLPEQIQITNFLDHETAKIDALIEKQQELIKLLKEKRQAVISHAVTKGLNPNAPMRDSGVEWLGEVPAHWTITKAKFLFGFITSGSRGWAEYYADDGDLFFRITNLTRDTIDPKLDSIQYVTPPNGSEGERSRIKLNDLLISITADLGSVCVANSEIENGYVSQHVALCRPNMHVACPRWLGYFILSDMAKEQFIGSGYGGTKIQLSLEDIRELWVVLPNVTEQIEIAVFIEKQFDIFDSLMFSADQQIKLLQERRTALISAAVTGKIDVRDWQPSSTSTQPKAAV